MRHGTWRHGAGLRLAVWAPRAEHLSVRVEDRVAPMAPAPGGWWNADLPVLPSGTPYALVFPDGRVRPDPAARAQVADVHGASALFDPGDFRWSDAAWTGLPLEALVFYELHVGTFTGAGTLDAAAERLPELVDLGVTCVELMPVQPFGGARNWGYDGVLLHAVHGAYGGPAALQRFVDRAHALGLGVCLDVVYNHLGPEGNYLSEFGPYTTSRHRSPWGDGMNYDGPDAGPVRAYMVQAARSWVEDFHVDALRLDAVHAIVDDSPVHLVQEIVRGVHQASAGRARVIAESDLNDRRVVDPPPGGWGCDAVWADDFHHAIHALLTGERGAFYADFGDPQDLVTALERGFVYQGQRSRFRNRPHGTPTDGLLPRQFVTCLQNHDQVGNRAHRRAAGEPRSSRGAGASRHAAAARARAAAPLHGRGARRNTAVPVLHQPHRSPAGPGGVRGPARGVHRPGGRGPRPPGRGDLRRVAPGGIGRCPPPGALPPDAHGQAPAPGSHRGPVAPGPARWPGLPPGAPRPHRHREPRPRPGARLAGLGMGGVAIDEPAVRRGAVPGAGGGLEARGGRRGAAGRHAGAAPGRRRDSAPRARHAGARAGRGGR